MNYYFIILAVIAIAVSIILLYLGLKGAFHMQEEEDPFIIQEEPKFQPRKITYIIGTDPYEEQKPKRRYKKRNKKKKPTVAQNETVEKRPVGRPRKTTE